MKDTDAARGAPDRLSTGAACRFAAAAFTLQAMTIALAVYVPQHLVSQLGLDLASVGGAFAVVRLIDIPVDPLLGIAMDRTRTRWGRYRLWMLLGLPIVTAAVYSLFMAPSGVSVAYVATWLFIFYAGHSTLSLAHMSWGAKLARSYQERSRIFGYVGAVGVAGMTLLLATPSLLSFLQVDGRATVSWMGWFLLATAPLTVCLAVFTVPEAAERGAASVPRSGLNDYVAVLKHGDMLRIVVAAFLLSLGTTWEGSIYIFFLTDARGWTVAEASLLLMIAVGAGLVGAPAVARLANAVGKHRALWISTTIYAASMISLAFAPPAPRLWTWLPLVTCGFFYSGFFVLLRAMTADVADDIRLSQGQERSALLYGLTTLAPKVASALAVWMGFLVLAHFGYSPSAHATNSPEAIRGLAATYLLGPFSFVAAAGLAMFGYRLGPRRSAEIREALATKAGVQSN